MNLREITLRQIYTRTACFSWYYNEKAFLELKSYNKSFITVSFLVSGHYSAISWPAAECLRCVVSEALGRRRRTGGRPRSPRPRLSNLAYLSTRNWRSFPSEKSYLLNLHRRLSFLSERNYIETLSLCYNLETFWRFPWNNSYTNKRIVF